MAAAIRLPLYYQDTFFFIAEGQGPQSLGVWNMFVEGEELDRDRFLASLEEVFRRHPKAASRLVRCPSLWGERLYWESLPGAARRSCFFHELDPTLRDPEAMEMRLAGIVNEPLDLASSPPIEFHWLPYDNRRAVMAIRFHHALCDGYGALVLLRDLFGYYNGTPPRWSPPPPAERQAPLVEGTLRFKLRLFSTLLAFHFRRSLSQRFSPPDTLYDTHRRPSGRLASLFRTIESRKLERYVAGAKEQGATFNDLFLAAHGLAVERWKTECNMHCGTLRIVVNQNLRKRDRRYVTLENRSSAFPIWLGPRERGLGKGLVDCVSRQVREAVRLRIAEATNIFGIVLKLPFGLARRLIAPAVSNPRISDSLIVSNMGRFPPPDPEGDEWWHLGEGQIAKMHIYGRPPDGIGVMSVPHSTGGRLTVSMAYLEGLFERRELVRLLEMTEAALDELAGCEDAGQRSPRGDL